MASKSRMFSAFYRKVIKISYSKFKILFRRGRSASPQRSSSLSRLEIAGLVFTNEPPLRDSGSRFDESRPIRRHRTPRPEVIHHNFSDPSPPEVRKTHI